MKTWQIWTNFKRFENRITSHNIWHKSFVRPKNHNYWMKFIFFFLGKLAKILWGNWETIFLGKLEKKFLGKIVKFFVPTFLNQNVLCQQKIRRYFHNFLRFLDNLFYYLRKFLDNFFIALIFDPNFDHQFAFWPNFDLQKKIFYILRKIVIFEQNFDFWPTGWTVSVPFCFLWFRWN